MIVSDPTATTVPTRLRDRLNNSKDRFDWTVMWGAEEVARDHCMFYFFISLELNYFKTWGRGNQRARCRVVMSFL